MSSKLQPVLWGGALIGVLSSLPYVSALNMCCCLWVIAGGVVTSYLLQERSTLPITAGDGAVSGLLAGLVGALVSSILTGLIMAATGTSFGDLSQIPMNDMPPEAQRMLERIRDLPPSVWILGPLLISIVVYPVFAMLGGLLGVAIFRKKLPPAAPDVITGSGDFRP